MDKLWAPWRMEYIRKPPDPDCIFCTKPQAAADRETLLLYRGGHCFVLMNLYPYNNGHLMIAPYQHSPSTHDLDPEAYREILWLADQSIRILEQTMRAQGFNFGANIGTAAGAGIEEHVHFHLVPRWVGDTNYMPVLGHTKVMVQGLQETWALLRPEFDRLPSPK